MAAQDGKKEKERSPYARAKERFKGDDEGLWEYLTARRSESISLALGYHIVRVSRELGWTQQDVVDVINSQGEPSYSETIITMVLTRENGSPELLCRIAKAVGANPIEFFVLMGWLTEQDVAAWQVPRAYTLGETARVVETIPEALRVDFLTALRALAKVFSRTTVNSE